jgi:MscS family membrane protein
MKWLFSFIISLALLSGSNAQKNTTGADLRSPYHTVVNHLKYLQDDNYRPEVAAQSLYFPNLTESERIDLSIKLKKVFDARGLYILVDEIPKNTYYFDSLREAHEYVVHKGLPEIYVKRYGNEWLYSEESVMQINKLYRETFILGIDKLIQILPKEADKKVFGIKIWQYIGLLIIVTIGVLIERLFEFLFRLLVRKMLKLKKGERLAKKLILPVTKPLSLIIVLSIVLLFIPALLLPINVTQYLILGIKALIPLLVTIVIYKLTDLLSDYLMAKAEKTENTLDDQLIPLLRKILKVFVVIIGGIYVLLNLNIDILPLLTGLSIGSLALAFAAQDTLKNFFGSIMIFIDRPFQIGQWITAGDADGTVEEVGFRSTRIRTFRNSLVYIPNAKLADTTIDNHGLRNYRRFYTKISLTYDTPPQLIEVFVEGLKDLVHKHPKTVKNKMEIHFNEMADFSLNIMFYIFFEVPTWSEELEARDEILLGILRLAESIGVNFAFPTTTLHMETFPEKQGLSPTYELDKSKLKQLKDDFIKNYQPTKNEIRN